jgi:hypothetical protein
MTQVSKALSPAQLHIEICSRRARDPTSSPRDADAQQRASSGRIGQSGVPGSAKQIAPLCFPMSALFLIR